MEIKVKTITDDASLIMLENASDDEEIVKRIGNIYWEESPGRSENE